MVNFSKQKKGITLIALVITIIVLLILAGISISMLSGDNGILQKTTTAKENTEKSQIEERIKLAYHSALTGGQGSYTKDTLMDELKNEFETDYDVDDSGDESWKMKAHGQEVTIPSGLKNNEESKYTPYDNPYIPTNFSHTVGTWNTGFTIIGNEGTENEGDEFIWVPCVLTQSSVKEVDIVQIFQKTLPVKAITDSDYSSDSNYAYNKNKLILHSSIDLNEDVAIEDSSVFAIRTSVEKYGGFYIAKYEAGEKRKKNEGTNEITEISSTAATVNQKARSVANATAWTKITRTNALLAASNMINNTETGVFSALISGECWDTALQWIKSTSDATYDINSVGKGWYSDVSAIPRVANAYYTHKTGYYGTNTNNIFDMGGCVAELTSENCKSSYGQQVVYRGGYFSMSGDFMPASSRSSINSDFSNDPFGFRVVLYK